MVILFITRLYCFLHKTQIHMQQNNNQSETHQQYQTVPTDNNQRPRRKLINKKSVVPLLVHFPFMFQISDSFFPAMKISNAQDFQNLSRTFQVFYCKTLRSVSFQNQNTVLKFRTIKQKFESVQTYIQQFKSLGDDYFYDLAVSYQFSYNQYKMFHCFKPQNIQNTKDTAHYQVMEDLLTKIKGKKYLAYFNENIQDQTCLSKIIISNQLLQATGYKKEELQLNFLKYKHVFFEIVNKEFFKKIYIELGHYAKKMIQENVEIATINQQNPHKKNLVVFNDFVYRKKVQQSGQQVEQKLNATIQFYKPHPKITMFEFQIDQKHVLSTIPRQKVSFQKQKITEMINQQQCKSLQHILEEIIQTKYRQ